MGCQGPSLGTRVFCGVEARPLLYKAAPLLFPSPSAPPFPSQVRGLPRAGVIRRWRSVEAAIELPAILQALGAPRASAARPEAFARKEPILPPSFTPLISFRHT